METLKIGQFEIYPTEIPGLWYYKNPVVEGELGGLEELTYRADVINELMGQTVPILQRNVSSSKPNVIRGLHAEPQTKVATPQMGIFRVAWLDIREDSPTVGRVVEMNVENLVLESPKTTFVISPGIANSFAVLDYPQNRPMAQYAYQVSSAYTDGPKRAIFYGDPEVAISWKVSPSRAIVSKPDQNHPTLAQFFAEKPEVLALARANRRTQLQAQGRI